MNHHRRRRRGKTVMLDAGIHPGFTGPASLPYFDEVEMEEVDALLVTHFHLDHVAAVPYVATKTTFKVFQPFSEIICSRCRAAAR